MSTVVCKALSLWGMDSAEWHLIAARENQVFRVDCEGQTFALRLHRPDYRTDAELLSELQWVSACAEGGLCVATPVAACSGNLLHVVDGVQVDLLTWLPGTPMGATGKPLAVNNRRGVFWALGSEMARLHTISDNWKIPAGFTRCAWDRPGLLGETPLWGRFWENPTLSDQDRELFETMRMVANDHLRELEADLDYGLIHADLVRENVMLDVDKLQMIDFDDGGFGFRLFDLATTLLKNMNEPDYPLLRTALLDGYRDKRELVTNALDLFLWLRAATYVGWIVSRMTEEGATARNARFVRNARDLALTYLADHDHL